MHFNSQKISILVVEDIEIMMKLMVSVLETLGIEMIYTANNGKDAFEIFCQYKPDIVLTDWHMVPSNGLDLIQKIRTKSNFPHKNVPIILMTGYSAMSRVAQARDVGTTEFLVKPFSAQDLSRRISYVINKPRDFIETSDFCGPDRRRNLNNPYQGVLRRYDDEHHALLKEIIELG